MLIVVRRQLYAPSPSQVVIVYRLFCRNKMESPPIFDQLLHQTFLMRSVLRMCTCFIAVSLVRARCEARTTARSNTSDRRRSPPFITIVYNCPNFYRRSSALRFVFILLPWPSWARPCFCSLGALSYSGALSRRFPIRAHWLISCEGEV